MVDSDNAASASASHTLQYSESHRGLSQRKAVIGHTEAGASSGHCSAENWLGKVSSSFLPCHYSVLSILAIDDGADEVAWLRYPSDGQLCRPPVPPPPICSHDRKVFSIRSHYQHSHCLKSSHSLCCLFFKTIRMGLRMGKELHHESVCVTRHFHIQ